MKRDKAPILMDKYDHAIEYLKQHPDTIYEAWANPESAEGKGGELFGFVGPNWGDSTGMRYNADVSGSCGCLQQIREAYVNEQEDKGVCDMGELRDTTCTLSYWPRLWAKIAQDERLPSDAELISLRDLHVFAEWQREVDIKRMQDGIEVAPSVY